MEALDGPASAPQYDLRVARQAELRLGRQRESIGVEELPDDAKPPILREY